MIEVLVTIFILAIGLLGLAGLQSRMQVSEMESYQRAQALILLNDMASRLSANQSAAASYATGVTYGAGMTCPTATTTRQEIDARDWCNALQGAGETTGGTRVGVMVGARGCVESLGGNEYLITVAWQGLVPLNAPPAGVACGQDAYDGAAGCTGDRCRRVVTTLIRIPTL